MNKQAVASELLKLAKSLTAGTWQIPKNPRSVAELVSIIRQMEQGNWPTRDGYNPITVSVDKILGDDALFDMIDHAGEKYLADCAAAIKKRVKEMVKDGPDSFQRPLDYEMMVELSKSMI